MEGFDPTVIMLVTALLVPIVGAFMAVTPYLMRRGEVFTVTVPTAEQNDPYVKGLKRRYAVIVGAATVAFTLVGFACAAAGNVSGVMVVLIVGSLALTAGGYGLMLAYRAKMTAYKNERGWEADVQESVAVVGEQPVPHAISVKWNLLYLPIMAVTFAVGAIGYAHMPDQIPMHMDFDGTVNRYADKTPLVLWMPVLIQAFMGLCFAFSHWTIARSKKWAEPGAPATSALAYGLFARAQSIYLVVGGVVIAIAMIAMPLSFMNLINLGQAAIFVMIAAIVLCVGGMAVSLVYGQAGSRVFKRMQTSDRLLVDDDRYWKFGVFYFNPDDASLFLPERFGVGWTLNWARPAVWAIVVGGLAITVAFVVAVMVLF
ncbi:DUF1648 domain-containing protein [Eggerthella sp. NSJ-70]|uniref:DUF1648 domain-containing protein n=1 Tax=Eggerthella hominis TaxID=2763043 RepID=A0ABR7BR99_9ACTN|nr:DUF1648 domain-containing protein [Eggerthella hominis]